MGRLAMRRHSDHFLLLGVRLALRWSTPSRGNAHRHAPLCLAMSQAGCICNAENGRYGMLTATKNTREVHDLCALRHWPPSTKRGSLKPHGQCRHKILSQRARQRIWTWARNAGRFCVASGNAAPTALTWQMRRARPMLNPRGRAVACFLS